MKDFAKSIVCNTKAEVAKVGNSSGIKEFNTEADLRRWCIEHQYAYTPTHGGYYRLEDDKPGRNRPDLYAHVKAGNSKVGNGITKFGTGTKVIADGHEAIVLKETVEQGPNGIPFGWVEIKWTEGPWKGQTDTQYDYDLKKKVGNSKVGNAYQYAGSIPIEKIPDNWRPEFPKAGYVVYYAPNKAKWFATEAEAKRFAESQDKAQKTGNSKVGNSGWIQGTSGNFAWTVLSFDEPSDYGINNGRISKLFIRDKTTTKVEANYDRGWDVRPSEKVKSLYNELIRKYN